VSDKPTPEDTALWQRRLASQANNRAWSLSEAASRTAQQDEEMLHAAHAAMYFWNIVGNDNNHAHASQLLAHVYALLRQPGPASHYQAQSQPVFFAQGAADWEVALAHCVAANVAASMGDTDAHGKHYRLSYQLVEQLPDPEDRKILEATLCILPRPPESAAGVD
jgi:hypothetical protein